ncbi:MAG: TolC family outer membrane protein [Pontibacterium sp.]
MFCKKIIIYFSLSVFFVSNSLAGELRELYQLALSNDATLKAAQASLNANTEVVVQSKASFLPSVTLSGEMTDLDSDDGDTNTNGYSLSVNQSLLDTGAWFTLKKAELLAEQSKTEFKVAEQDLVLRVIVGYLDALRSQASLEAASARERSFEYRLEQAIAQFNASLLANSDVQEAQAAFDNATVARLRASGSVAESIESLEVMTGELFTVRQQLGSEFPKVVEGDLHNPWLEKALSDNLVLKAARLATMIAERDVQIAKAEAYPTLSLSMTHERERNSRANRSVTENSVALSLSVPIYTGGAVSSRLKESEYRLQEAKQNFEAELRRVAKETKSLDRGLEIEAKSINALKQSLKSRRVALAGFEAGYKAGTRNLGEVLDAEDKLYEASLSYSDARFLYIRNKIELSAQIGKLDSHAIDEIDGWLGDPP